MSDDRRRAPRMAMALPVVVRCPGYPEMILTTGDISRTGFYLCCDPATFPPIGTEVELQASKPAGDGEDPPLIRAQVVRADPHGVGLLALD